MAAKKRRRTPKARYTLTGGAHGPSCLLLNSHGRVVNLIHGGAHASVEDVRRAARHHFPDAVEVEEYGSPREVRRGDGAVDYVVRKYRRKKP